MLTVVALAFLIQQNEPAAIALPFLKGRSADYIMRYTGATTFAYNIHAPFTTVQPIIAKQLPKTWWSHDDIHGFEAGHRFNTGRIKWAHILVGYWKLDKDLEWTNGTYGKWTSITIFEATTDPAIGTKLESGDNWTRRILNACAAPRSSLESPSAL